MPIPTPDEVAAASQYLDLAEQAIQQLDDGILQLRSDGEKTQKRASQALHQARCLGRNLRRLIAEARFLSEDLSRISRESQALH